VVRDAGRARLVEFGAIGVPENGRIREANHDGGQGFLRPANKNFIKINDV
jgi:hypothetical protein